MEVQNTLFQALEIVANHGHIGAKLLKLLAIFQGRAATTCEKEMKDYEQGGQRKGAVPRDV